MSKPGTENVEWVGVGTINVHDRVLISGCHLIDSEIRVAHVSMKLSGGTFSVPGWDYPFPDTEGPEFTVEADLSTNLYRAGWATELIHLWADSRPLDFDVDRPGFTMTLTDTENNILVLPLRAPAPKTVKELRRNRSRRLRNQKIR